MSDTNIQWTHLPGYRGVTWNPIRGCSRVSPGCGGGTAGPGKGGCYAESIAARFSGPGQPFEGFAERAGAGARWTGKVDLLTRKLAEPLSWRAPRCCFVNSMSDLFHEALDFEEIGAVVGSIVLAAMRGHQMLTLTKRAGRQLAWFNWIQQSPDPVGSCVALARLYAPAASEGLFELQPGMSREWPVRGWWLGVSAEDQQRWDERALDLLRCPAAVRFVSAEPLLGPIDFTEAFLRGEELNRNHGISQVIVGAESGHGARPMNIEWARSIRDQCQGAGVAFFMKQLATPAGKKVGDLDKMPPDLRIRQWPPVA